MDEGRIVAKIELAFKKLLDGINLSGSEEIPKLNTFWLSEFFYMCSRSWP